MSYNSKHTGLEIDNLLGLIPGLEKAVNTHNKEVKFFCIEPVVVRVGDVTHTCEANQIATVFVGDENFEIIPTSNRSIKSLLGYPIPLTWYDWLEGVDTFENIVFDMNELETYKHWIQYYQGDYHVQKAQYSSCIFWSDKPYTHSPFEERTNYTLYYSAELPLCYSRIPENTYKPFYLAYGVKTDPNWNNPDYVNSYSLVSGATQTFSYYGATAIGIFDMAVDVITLPKDCRGLMYHAPAITHAGVFDATKATNFGAKKGSWQDAFGDCISLTSLYIMNLKASINISWSPINNESIEFIVNNAANTSAITISVSPYTWYRLTDDIKAAASAKNITIALLEGNYFDDSRWATKQDKITDLDEIRSGASKGATALQSVPAEYVTEAGLMWTKVEGEAGVRLKGTNGTATGNSAISAGDDKTASDGTPFASVASGDHAVAFGYGNTCAGRTTLAQGLYNTVNNKDSVAFGQRNLVNGDQAFAVGQQNEVTARMGVAIGYKNTAANANSTAIGYQNTASGSGAVALGDTCESAGTSSTAMGYKTKATGAYSTTFGQNTQATNSGEVAMGSYNKSTTSTSASEQTAFSFGIGTSDTDRANAFEIKKNGDVYFGDKILSGVATSGSYQDLTDKPSIPSAVTESTVSGWGFTKNTGTYSKPSTGIPKTDLASAVQTSLEKADTALQSYTEKYTGTYSKPSTGIPKSDLASAVQTSLEKADTALQSYTEKYTGTVTGVKINGSTKAPSSGTVDIGNVVTSVKINGSTKSPSSGVVDLGTVVTSHQDISGKQDKLVSGTTIKTINGESILGNGDIVIKSSGGGNTISGISAYYGVITFGAAGFESMQPNVTYVQSGSDEVTGVTIVEFAGTEELYAEYSLIFKTMADDDEGWAPYITAPDYIKWANGEAPALDYDTVYELSISRAKMPWGDEFNAIIIPFKTL